MHLLVAFLGYLSLFFIYSLFKKYVDKKLAFFITWFFALNLLFVLYSTNYILSDIPYLFFASFTILMASRYMEKPSFINKEGFWVIFGLILSYFTRYIGLTLFSGLLIPLLLTDKKNKFKKILFIGGSFLFVFAIWNVLKLLNPTRLSYHFKQLLLVDPYAPYKGSLFAQPFNLFLRFIEGVNYYAVIIGRSLFFYIIKKWDFLSEALNLFSIVIVLFGLWLNFRKNRSCIFHYYFLFFVFFIVFWPFREGERFILPILPLVFFYFFTGLKAIFGLLPNKISYFCFLSLFLMLFILNILSFPNKKYSYQELPQSLKHFISLHKWIRENLSDENIIISRKPTITYFYTNHKAINYPFSFDPEEIWREIRRDNVKYIISDEFSYETYLYLMPFLYKNKDKFKLLYHVQNTGIFEVKEE